MVMIKLRCKLGEEAATLCVRITTSSPTISLSALESQFNSTSPSPILQLSIHISTKTSLHPSRPLTFCTSGTIFTTSRPAEGHIDALALGPLGPGLVHTKADGSHKSISLGNLRIHRARQANDSAPNLLERPDTSFITVPSQASGEECVVTHDISAARLFAFAEQVSPEDLRVGETYAVRLREDYLGTMWWCWGGLEGELKGRKLHAFSEGFCCAGGEERPSEEEGWVIGEDVARLVFE
ncbi:hypothetical protein CC86DRAFT_326573, partial [Ophiobolus disseminans]